MKFIKQIFNGFEEYLSILLFSVLIILGFLQVIFRFFFNFSLDWTEEMSRYIFICLVYVAASLAVQRRRHVRVEVIDMFLNTKQRHYLGILVNVIWMLFSVIVALEGVVVAEGEITQLSPALGVSMAIFYAFIPFGFFLMALRILQNIIEDIRTGGKA